MRGEPTVAIVGAEGESTTQLAGDLRRLNYRVQVIAWSSSGIGHVERSPIAVIVDLRTLGVDAARARQAVRQDRALRKAAVVALVHEQEGPRLDFSLGFDDLILAPYRLTELAARLRLLEWRTQRGVGPEIIRVGPLTLNQLTYEVAVEGQQVELTLKEYQLLLFFVRNPGRVFTRGDLLDRVWGVEYFGGTRTVDVHVRRLRAKTGAAGEMLETVRGVGYRLVVPAGDAEE